LRPKRRDSGAGGRSCHSIQYHRQTIGVELIGSGGERVSHNKEIATQGYAVNVIDTKGIEMQSIQANELLDRSAGVRIRQSGGLGSRIEYNINGLSGNSIRIFINGTPIANYGPSFSLSSIPTSMIERIEVYKGVVPAHLSDDALGGAINVVLKRSSGNSLGASYSVRLVQHAPSQRQRRLSERLNRVYRKGGCVL
jgi:outer membrane cobalamin receptor